MLPFDYSREPFWEIVDDIPDLEVPEVEAEDSVYVKEDRLKLIMPIEGDPAEVEVINYEGMTVKSLKHFIEQRGGKVDPEWLKADLIREARELEEASRAASEDSTEAPAEQEPEAKPEPVSDPETFEATHSNLGEDEVDPASAEEDLESES